jgi:hypothetical protein
MAEEERPAFLKKGGGPPGGKQKTFASSGARW